MRAVGLGALALSIVAQDHQHAPAGAAADEKLGTVHWTTSCSAQAQPRFDRAVALLHSFDFQRAIDGFTAALEVDPHCTIADWGIALSRWGNPFAAGQKAPVQLDQGLAAIQHARATPPATPRERDYVAAAAHLFDEHTSVDQVSRLHAYRDAMSAVAARYSDDTEATIFYALAVAAAADPTDKSYADLLKAGGLLEPLFAKQPDHPGLAHYIIHAYDVPPLAGRALDAARRYARIAPSAPHALHMPSHTFTRVGLWQESIDTNLLSAAEARRVGATSEELHASDYLTYAYLQTAQDRAAAGVLAAVPDMLGRFSPAATGAAAPPSAGAFAAAAIPARYALERGQWAAAAALQVRASSVPYAEAMTYYARAIGAARIGDARIVRASLEALPRLRTTLAAAGEAYWTEQVDIQSMGATAWLAWAEGRTDDALRAMRDAADREDRTEKNAITPGPLAPAREMLGDMLAALGQARQARVEYEAVLVREPNRFRALYGAAHAAAAAGDRTAATKDFRQLVDVCGKADRPGRPELDEARRFLGAS